MKVVVYMIVAMIAVGIVVMAWILQKDNMSGLIMPGPLAAAHAEHEKNCGACHASFDKTFQSNLCLDCHEPIAADISGGTGFHGRSPTVRDKQCKTCHTDHIGRDADIVSLDKAVFNHDWTDFPLDGAHASSAVGCAGCHEEGKKLREAQRECYSCHRERDVHDGQLGTACADCHQSTRWQDTRFNHDETEFPLTGRHKEVSCASCHVRHRYKETPRECVACHLINDIHDSPVDSRCQDCHRPDGWEEVTFDHAKTQFPLEDKHAQVTCQGCHTGLLFRQETGTKCADCHMANDVHKGRNGIHCDECHNVKSWVDTRFDHDRDTKFPLRGRHSQAQCEACHKSDSREQLPGRECIDCHAAEDIHRGQLRDCGSCHNEDGWDTHVRFDHDLTSFPLIGMHAAIGCEECHVSGAFKSVASDCRECHAKDDTHEGTLGPRCGDCHNPNDWRLWEFDHNSRTDFPLSGKHAELVCADCHREPVTGEMQMTTACAGCHEKDNVHARKFRDAGHRCELCHNDTNFEQIKDEDIRSFHRKPQDFDVLLVENCYSCHIDTDVHEGEFGQRCNRCHGVESWKDILIGR